MGWLTVCLLGVLLVTTKSMPLEEETEVNSSELLAEGESSSFDGSSNTYAVVVPGSLGNHHLSTHLSSCIPYSVTFLSNSHGARPWLLHCGGFSNLESR